MAIPTLNDADLLTVISADTTLRRVASTNGGEWCGSCPFCGGTDRFRVWPDHPKGSRWWCRQCSRSGDAIAYQVERGDITPQEAGRLRRGDTAHQMQPRRSQAEPSPEARQDAPHPIWDPSAALAVVTDCEAALWGEAGAKAREWLHERGLSGETIHHWRLGYNPAGCRIHGLWTPRGIVIPCFVGDVLWYVKVRRPVPPLAGPKYQQMAGGKSALYGLDHLAGRRVAVICEGELDAVLLWQEAGDLVDVVATGSASGRPALPFLVHLAGAARWLVALDRDDAGEQGADWWGDYSARVRRVRPLQGKDLTDFAQAGGDLRAWATYHLERLALDAPGDALGGDPPADRPEPAGARRIEGLESTEAGLSAALAILEAATGCDDAEAERLLAHWDGLNTEYDQVVEAMRAVGLDGVEVQEVTR